MIRKPIIISLSSHSLKPNEKRLISKYKPWGIILFKRNIKSNFQIKKLIKDIRLAARDKKYPIIIDEEGLNVSRLSNLFNNSFNSEFFGKLFEKDEDVSLALYRNYLKSICIRLSKIGVNINTIPVLDLKRKYTNKILNGRTFSKKKNVIHKLGNECISVLKRFKIGAVIKHIPGHGYTRIDSHKSLPKIRKSFNYLKNKDFQCFKGKKAFFAMTAHILYSNIDDTNPASQSKIIIQDIIRREIKFKGLIISDDISMNALKYDLVENAKKCIAAGCNLVLYCSGKYNESKKLLQNLEFCDAFTRKKTSEFYKFLR